MSDEASLSLLDKVQPFILIAAVIIGIVAGLFSSIFNTYV